MKVSTQQLAALPLRELSRRPDIVVAIFVTLFLLFNTFAVASMIREGKAFQVANAILGGKKDGMLSLDESLQSLVAGEVVDPADALERSLDPDAFLALQAELRRRGIEVPFQAMRDASPDLLDEDIAHVRQILMATKVGEREG